MRQRSRDSAVAADLASDSDSDYSPDERAAAAERDAASLRVITGILLSLSTQGGDVAGTPVCWKPSSSGRLHPSERLLELPEACWDGGGGGDDDRLRVELPQHTASS